MTKSTFILIIILVLLSILEIIVFASMKQYSNTKNKWFFVMSIIGYIMITILLIYSFNFNHMSIVNSLWNAISIISISILGYLAFNEKLNWKEVIAITIIIIGSIILLAVNNEKNSLNKLVID